MNSIIPDYVEQALHDLEIAVCRDTYNLTRDDHDAIIIRIQQLKDFIAERYAQRRNSIAG